jgi:hypothetical protein
MFMRVARPSALDDGGCGLLGFLAKWSFGDNSTRRRKRESLLKLAGATLSLAKMTINF